MRGCAQRRPRARDPVQLAGTGPRRQSCLDLFAGSGALGFEALSRGAARVVMVEKSRRVCEALRRNAQLLGAKNLSVHCADALEFATAAAARCGGAFRRGVSRSAVPFELARSGAAAVASLLRTGARVYIESAAAFAPTGGWRVFKQGRAGQVHYTLVTYAD